MNEIIYYFINSENYVKLLLNSLFKYKQEVYCGIVIISYEFCLVAYTFDGSGDNGFFHNTKYV